MKRILITGENSYIGDSFKSHLQKWPEKYQVETVDMIDGSWREKDFSQFDAVYHVAGIAHADTGKVSQERIDFYYKINTELAVETAQKAKKEGVKQFVFMSSAIVYGESAPIGKRKIINKETQPHPANFYGDSKWQAELGLNKLRDEGFKIVILRPPMIYGKGSKGNYPVLAKAACKLPVFPKISNERSMLYVGNLVEFVRLMIENEEDGIFWPQNIEWSNTSSLVKMIAEAHNKKILLVPGCTLLLKGASHMTSLINKAFGNLAYEQEMSIYKQEYRLFSLEESIQMTERC